MTRIRILTVILLGALVTGALAGCQAAESPSADQTVVTFAYPAYLTAFNEANYQRLADAFNDENPDLRVELREISTDELRQKDTYYLDLIFDEELGMDVFLSRSFRMLLGDENLLDVGPLVAVRPEFDLGDFYPLALDTVRQGGSLWGLPAEIDPVVIYYNKDLFDQAGVPYPPSFPPYGGTKGGAGRETISWRQPSLCEKGCRSARWPSAARWTRPCPLSMPTVEQ